MARHLNLVNITGRTVCLRPGPLTLDVKIVFRLVPDGDVKGRWQWAQTACLLDLSELRVPTWRAPELHRIDQVAPMIASSYVESVRRVIGRHFTTPGPNLLLVSPDVLEARDECNQPLDWGPDIALAQCAPGEQPRLVADPQGFWAAHLNVTG